MGTASSFRAFALLFFATMVLAGCQTQAPVSMRQFEAHQASINRDDLRPTTSVPELKMIGAAPDDWRPLSPHKTPVYTHQQWKSPSGKTGIGVVYIRMPLPLSAKMLVWLARKEYRKTADEGQVVREWTDNLGRLWFEANNGIYQVRGYALTRGLDAWIVYSGCKSALPANQAELSIAARAAQTMIPLINNAQIDDRPIVSIDRDPNTATP